MIWGSLYFDNVSREWGYMACIVSMDALSVQGSKSWTNADAKVDTSSS